MYWAARHGHLDVVKFLCQNKASLDLQDKVRICTLLSLSPSPFLTPSLILYFDLSTQSGETALHVSARYGHPEVLAYLCHSGAKLNLQDKVCMCCHIHIHLTEVNGYANSLLKFDQCMYRRLSPGVYNIS